MNFPNPGGKSPVDRFRGLSSKRCGQALFLDTGQFSSLISANLRELQAEELPPLPAGSASRTHPLFPVESGFTTLVVPMLHCC